MNQDIMGFEEIAHAVVEIGPSPKCIYPAQDLDSNGANPIVWIFL